MSLQIQKSEGGAPEAGMVADRRLYLTPNQENPIDAKPGDRLVEDGHPDARFLLAGEGGVIPASEVARLKLVVIDGKVQQQPDVPAVQEEESGGADS